jgi:hypothetical protein
MRTLTAGPASAISNSWVGLSGIRSMLATPPIGSRMMSRVPMPNRRAISTCPYSCASTQAKMATMKPTAAKAAAAPP